METQQAFGSKAAVAAFDRLGNTIAAMAAADAHLPSNLIHRTLDDVPIVTPSLSEKGKKFAEAYKSICMSVNIALAPNCPHLEKAFEDSQIGTVLGITFDTNSLQWSLPQKKTASLIKRINNATSGSPLSLTETQQLMGSLNDFGQMCPLLKVFRLPLVHHLSSYNTDPTCLIPLSSQAVSDLKVWAAVAAEAESNLPILHRPSEPPLNCVVFVSDAAGAPYAKCN